LRHPARLAAAAVALLGFAVGALWYVAGDGDDTAPHPVAVTISGESLAIAANRIRFADQRRGGALPRVDLAVLWPNMAGRTATNRDAFALPRPDTPVLQIAIEPSPVALDSAARLASVYLRYFAADPPDESLAPPVDGLVARRFVAGSPYADETLYFEPGSVHPFVARCFPRAEGDERRLCLTEIGFGKNLVAAIRFPPALLADWRRLQDACRDLLDGLNRP
jgi:hypothetical protein